MARNPSVSSTNGGVLNVNANGSSGGCDYSNQKGIERKTNIGGILNNRSNGTTFINAANFINSSSGDKGGRFALIAAASVSRAADFGLGTALLQNNGGPTRQSHCYG
jgi:hypothetical protein